MAPPGAAAVASTRPFHGGRDRAPATPEELLRIAHVLLDNVGVRMSHTKLVKVVRIYVKEVARNGLGFDVYLCNQLRMDADQRANIMRNYWGFLDLTGEGAAHNVDNERARRARHRPTRDGV